MVSMASVESDLLNEKGKEGNLILVTAITPTGGWYRENRSIGIGFS